MNKRIFSIWGVGLLVFGVLICAGCGGKEEIDSVDGTQSKIVQPDPKPEEMPVTPAGKVALAIEYYTGEGRTVDYTKAANLFRQAANHGSSEAQFALGCMYQNGHGVTQNFMEAADWYSKSAQADNPNAQFLLGLSYKEGSGVPRDPMESYKWIYLAAEAGNTQHIAARQALEQSYTPNMLAEGRRRADQFRMYQGVQN